MCSLGICKSPKNTIKVNAKTIQWIPLASWSGRRGPLWLRHTMHTHSHKSIHHISNTSKKARIFLIVVVMLLLSLLILRLLSLLLFASWRRGLINWSASSVAGIPKILAHLSWLKFNFIIILVIWISGHKSFRTIEMLNAFLSFENLFVVLLILLFFLLSFDWRNFLKRSLHYFIIMRHIKWIDYCRDHLHLETITVITMRSGIN